MEVCVCGWYFDMALIKALHDSKHEAMVVAHKSCEGLPLRSVTIPNQGLEFGAYDWFVKNEWQGQKTLFMHDDASVTQDALGRIEQMDVDQAFLFSSEEEAKANGNAHGRAFVCSDRFLQRLKDEGGFWYDESNHGDIAPTNGNPDYHNNGILMFRSYLETCPKDWSVGLVRVVPGLKNGYRGEVDRG